MTEYGYGLVQILSNDVIYDFGTITGITDSLNKSISAIPIVSLSTDSTFALESETSNQYSISFVRRTPFKESGDTYSSDPDYGLRSWMWTNSTWQERTTTLINRWQSRQGGFTLWINHNLDENGVEITGVQNGQVAGTSRTSLLPKTTCNIFIKSLSFSLKAGDTDTLSGTLNVIVGGNCPIKQELDAKNNKTIGYYLTSTGCSEVNGIVPNNAYGKSGLNELHRIDPVPLFATGLAATTSYNVNNEYTEYIGKSDKYCSVDFKSADGNSMQLILLLGAETNTTKLDYEQNTEDKVNVITDITLTGGPQYPFESIKIQAKMKEIQSVYPELSTENWDGSGESYGIIVGEARIVYIGAGVGSYVCTAYEISDSTLTITGYTEAAVFASTSIKYATVFSNGPYVAISDMLCTNDYGLNHQYESGQLISNISVEKWNKESFTVKSGTNVWVVLQFIAHMLHARLFFTGRYGYLIDYTTIFTGLTEQSSSDAESTNTNANRLIIRDALDLGNYISTTATDSKMEDISFECHNINSRSRISSRIQGNVESPRSSTKTLVNSVKVTYISGSTTCELGFGTYESYGSAYTGPYEKDTTDSSGYSIAKNISWDDAFLDRAKASIDTYGEMHQDLDLTQYFSEISKQLVWEIIYSIIDYNAETVQESKMTVWESYKHQATSDKTENNEKLKTDFWSAMFPTVCEIQRLTDIEQDVVVSSESILTKGPNGEKVWRPDKNYLASYTHSSTYKSTYTFGTPMSTTLAASINGQNVKISALASSVRQ